VRDTIILGAGSVGGHIVSNAKAYGISERIIGFLDDDPAKKNTFFYGYNIIDTFSWLENKSQLSVVLGIAFPKIKKKIYDNYLAGKKFNFPILVHPQSWISEECDIQKGTIIYPNTSINYGSRIGEFCVLNMNCAVGHHSSIGDFSSLAPGVNLGGHTKLDFQVDMGINSSTKQFIHISNNVVVGGQSMVLKDVAAGQTVVGVPAKSI